MLRRPWLRREPMLLQRSTTGAFEWVFLKRGSGPPLLLIHGLSGSVRWWRRTIPPLAQRFTVYAVELRGFAGNRGRPLPLIENAEGLAAFMMSQQIEQAHLIGHSMGAQICIHLAAAFPERVDRLVLAAPSGLLRRGLVTMGLRLARAGRYGAIDFVPTLALDALRAGPVNLLLAARALLKDDVAPRLAAIRAPTLVIAGERDVLVPPAVCAAVAEGISNATFQVVERAGHNLMWDRADAFNDAVLQFLTT
jgi:pimeloyl-ACP methyl ester carboxylesterase